MQCGKMLAIRTRGGAAINRTEARMTETTHNAVRMKKGADRQSSHEC
jgi:hypothetical protein